MLPLLQKIKALAKRPQKKISYKKEGVYPLRDWKIIFFGFTVALALLSGISVYLYAGIISDTLFSISSDNTSGQINIDDTLFQKTIRNINTRLASSTEITQGKISFPDPSI